MSTKHGQIQGSLQVLASMVEALKQAQQGKVESLAQVQETLCRTASMGSDLKARLGATSATQEQSRVTPGRVQIVSEKGHEGDTNAASCTASDHYGAKEWSHKDRDMHPRTEREDTAPRANKEGTIRSNHRVVVSTDAS